MDISKYTVTKAIDIEDVEKDFSLKLIKKCVDI